MPRSPSSFSRRTTVRQNIDQHCRLLLRPHMHRIKQCQPGSDSPSVGDDHLAGHRIATLDIQQCSKLFRNGRHGGAGIQKQVRPDRPSSFAEGHRHENLVSLGFYAGGLGLSRAGILMNNHIAKIAGRYPGVVIDEMYHSVIIGILIKCLFRRVRLK